MLFDRVHWYFYPFFFFFSYPRRVVVALTKTHARVYAREKKHSRYGPINCARVRELNCVSELPDKINFSFRETLILDSCQRSGSLLLLGQHARAPRWIIPEDIHYRGCSCLVLDVVNCSTRKTQLFNLLVEANRKDKKKRKAREGDFAK